MYLSQLLVDVGENPDRPRPGRLWLRNIYHVHQRLWMGFPTEEQRQRDPQFLEPFESTGFQSAPFLFRVDSSIRRDASRAVIVVQSDIEPDWDYAFRNAPMLAFHQERQFQPSFNTGEKYSFRIRVNLSKKSRVHTKRKEDTDRFGRRKSQGKRVSVTWGVDQNPEAVVREWFSGKAKDKADKNRNAFLLNDFRLVNLGWIGGYKPKRDSHKTEKKLKFRSALLEGTMTVSDAHLFEQLVRSGIGPAKAFGFGLLSLARA